MLGKIAHENLSSVSNLMDKLGGQCDMLALVGDLYDHTRNYDPAYFAGSSKATMMPPTPGTSTAEQSGNAPNRCKGASFGG